jgi:hypothetical protein
VQKSTETPGSLRTEQTVLVSTSQKVYVRGVLIDLNVLNGVLTTKNLVSGVDSLQDRGS